MLARPRSGRRPQVLVAAYLSRRAVASTQESRRDTQKQSWRIYARVFSCQGCKSGGMHSLERSLGSHVTLEVSQRVGGHESHTVPRQKDAATAGCDFGGQKLRTVALLSRRSAQVKFSVVERAADGQAALGTVSIPLANVPVIKPSYGSGHRKEPAARRCTLTYRRLLDGHERTNGSVLVAVWMTPLLPPSTVARRVSKAVFFFVVAFVLALWLALATKLRGGLHEAFLLVAPIPLCMLFLELPQLLGTALTAILKAAVPGLNMHLGAIRLQAWFSDTRRTPTSTAQDVAALAAGAARRLCLRIEVDDFRIRNPGARAEHSHENFVAAARVSLALSMDARLAHGAIDLVPRPGPKILCGARGRVAVCSHRMPPAVQRRKNHRRRAPSRSTRGRRRYDTRSCGS